MSRIEIRLTGNDGETVAIGGEVPTCRADGKFRSIRQLMDRLGAAALIGESIDFVVTVQQCHLLDREDSRDATPE